MSGNVQDPLLAVLPFLILLLPLAGFIVLWIFGDAIQRQHEAKGAAWLACATVLGSFGLSVWAILHLLRLMPVEQGLRFYQPALGQSLAEGLMWMEVVAPSRSIRSSKKLSSSSDPSSLREDSPSPSRVCGRLASSCSSSVSTMKVFVWNILKRTHQELRRLKVKYSCDQEQKRYGTFEELFGVTYDHFRKRYGTFEEFFGVTYDHFRKRLRRCSGP